VCIYPLLTTDVLEQQLQQCFMTQRVLKTDDDLRRMDMRPLADVSLGLTCAVARYNPRYISYLEDILEDRKCRTK
jgi:hypothetical protein